MEKAPGILAEKKRDEKRKRRSGRRRWKEKASNKQHWLTIKAGMGCLPGGRELSNDCWEEARWAALLPCCWCDCRNGGTVGTEASSRASLSADLELLHRLPPSAIIHSRRTPHEADDGCLACGPSTLAVVWDNCKKWIFGENGGSLEKLLFLKITYSVNQYKTVYVFSPVYGCGTKWPSFYMGLGVTS